MSSWGVVPTEKSQFPFEIELSSSPVRKGEGQAKIMDNPEAVPWWSFCICHMPAFLSILSWEGWLGREEKQTSLTPCSFSSCSPRSAEDGDRLAMNQELNKKFVCTAPLGSMCSREAMRGEAVGLRDSAWELNPHGLVFKTKTAQCQGKNPNDFFFNFS